MADTPEQSAPIGYQGAHEGPTRVLNLRMKRALKNIGAVHVTIDGAPHVLTWGTTSFEVPADRPVTVRVHQLDILQRVFGNAEIELSPSDPADLEYQAPAHHKQPGDIGPPGTTRVHGRRTYIYIGCLLSVAAFLVLLLVLIIVAIA